MAAREIVTKIEKTHTCTLFGKQSHILCIEFSLLAKLPTHLTSTFILINFVLHIKELNSTLL